MATGRAAICWTALGLFLLLSVSSASAGWASKPYALAEAGAPEGRKLMDFRPNSDAGASQGAFKSQELGRKLSIFWPSEGWGTYLGTSDQFGIFEPSPGGQFIRFDQGRGGG